MHKTKVHFAFCIPESRVEFQPVHDARRDRITRRERFHQALLHVAHDGIRRAVRIACVERRGGRVFHLQLDRLRFVLADEFRRERQREIDARRDAAAREQVAVRREPDRPSSLLLVRATLPSRDARRRKGRGGRHGGRDGRRRVREDLHEEREDPRKDRDGLHEERLNRLKTFADEMRGPRGLLLSTLADAAELI